MTSVLISGKRKLSGELNIQGSKNAVLPIMAAALLPKGVCRLHGCPKIRDVREMIKLLEKTGARVYWEGDTLCIDSTLITPAAFDTTDTASTRASILMLGAMLSRVQACSISLPGGCAIGSRPVDLHLYALTCLGYKINEQERIVAEGGCPGGTEICFSYPSVGATQNAIMASVFCKKETRIKNAAREPEVVSLCEFLNSAGANIYGAGTREIRICGVDRLYPVDYCVPSDRIVLGTYLLCVLAAGGDVIFNRVCPKEQGALLHMLRKAGAELETEERKIRVCSKQKTEGFGYVKTAPYPGFPTDMQSQLMAVATVCKGTSTIEEAIFESRMSTAGELIKMGADITIRNNIATISGVETLRGAKVAAGDLRGAAALVIAGLSAEGKTEMSGYEYLCRGYEKMIQDLCLLGADVTIG